MLPTPHCLAMILKTLARAKHCEKWKSVFIPTKRKLKWTDLLFLKCNLQKQFIVMFVNIMSLHFSSASFNSILPWHLRSYSLPQFNLNLRTELKFESHPQFSAKFCTALEGTFVRWIFDQLVVFQVNFWLKFQLEHMEMLIPVVIFMDI